MPQQSPKTAPTLSSTVAAVVLALLGLAGCGKDETATPGAQGAASPEKGGAEAAPGKKPPGQGAKGGASAVLAYRTGQQLLLKGEQQKALAQFERAVELDPKMSEAYLEIGRLQVHFSSQNVGSQVRDLDTLEKGIAALQEAYELEPNNDDYWFWAGRAHFLKDDLRQAITHLSKAVELNPLNAAAWKALGLAQNDASETEAARASFQKAVEADPADAGAHFQLGQAVEVLGDLAGARAAYEKAIEVDPTRPEVYGRLTQVCGKLGDRECEERARTAMEHWDDYHQKLVYRRTMVNQNPGDAEAIRLLGKAYADVGKWSDALEWFMRAVHVDAKDARTHLYCGVAHRNLKDYERATQHLKEAEFLAPDSLDPKLELMRLYAETKDEANWRDLVSATESVAEQDGESLFAMAEVCRELGRTEDAERLSAKARALGVTGPAETATGGQ